MNPIKVKICGIKREDEIQLLNQFPVSYAGFIFAKSKRQITGERCLQLSKNLRKDIQKVGVFVNAPIDTVLEIIKMCQLDVVQLHGDESIDYISQLPIKVWKTIPVKNQQSLEQISLYENHVQGILFETYHEKLKGGTGVSFDWQLLTTLKQPRHFTTILAGGIRPENAYEAISIVQPDILDVNSGLEVNGYKSIHLIHDLFKELSL